jgi:translocation and assembly module TamB
VTGTAKDLSIGEPIVDRLLGPSPTIRLALEGNLPRNVTIKAAQLAGVKARLDAQGALADRNLNLTFTANLDEAAAIDPALRGQIAADGKISGTIDAPLVATELKSPVLTVAGRRLEEVTLSTKAADLLASPKVDLDGTTRLDRLPARISTSVLIEGERIAASNLALTLGRSKLTGDVAMANRLLTGKLVLSAPDLRELGQLAGTASGGDLSATLQLDSAKGQQRASLLAAGHGIGLADALKTSSLELNATGEDLLGRPSIAADLNLRDPVIAGHPLTTASLTAKGPLSGLQARLSLTGTDLNAAAAAEVAQIAEGYRIGIQSLTAEVKNIQVKNKGPATIEIGAKATRIDHLALQIEDGSVQLGGSLASDDMKLSGKINSIPLSLARAFEPDIPITGRLDGEVEVSGKPAAPSGRFSIAGTKIGATDVPDQQADLHIAGRLQEGRLDVNGDLTPKGGGALTFTATLPSLSPDARLQADAKGTFDLVLVNTFLAGGADRVRGKGDIDLTAAGKLSAPQLTGRLRLVDASYENLLYGVKLRRIAADVRADGTNIRIASLTGTTPGGGRVTGEGEVNLANGVETALRIQTRKASIFDTDLLTATVDSDLTITGTPQSRLNLGGSMKVLKADIRVPDKLPPSVQEIEVKEVNVPPQKAALVAQTRQPPKQTLIIGLDLSIDAPQQVTVRGRGLDVELGGSIHAGGTNEKPEIEGAFKLRRGSLELAGKRLDFTEGQLTFEGGEQINPLLDLTAVTRAQDLQVTAKVEGPASSPRITLSSVPTMPDDEILARLLFGKSAGALSPFELLQLAEATADLAGVNAGPDVLDKLRKSTGLDRLSVEQTEGGTGPSLSAGRYVAKGVYVGVSQGARSGSSAATVEIEVTPNVKIESEIGSNAAGKAGVNLEWDY